MNLPVGDSVKMALLGQRQLDSCAARILACDGRNLALLAPERIALGTAVKLTYGETVLLGEVTYCTPHDGGVRVGVWLEERLCEVSQLEHLIRAILDSASDRRQGAEANHHARQ